MELQEVGYPNPEDDAAIDGWAEQVITPLHSEAAMIWRRDEDAWRLLGTWGEGIVFSGDLVISESLFRGHL